MAPTLGRSAGAGLVRSCIRGDWIRSSRLGEGVELLRAWFGGRAYERHRHDTYAISVTEAGVQTFDYRGRVERSLPGQVVVLHPDEMHDGRPGTDAGFGYRIVYVEPGGIAGAVRAIKGRPVPFPFVREPVSDNRTLAAAVTAAFLSGPEPLAVDALVLRLAEGLLEEAADGDASRALRTDRGALERARAFLDGRRTIVRSAELEAVTGLNRYELARQFRASYGTSPYRYSLMRRLDFARQHLGIGGMPLAELALEAGFADQAHFTRMFRSAFGVTPGRYAELRFAEDPVRKARDPKLRG